MRRLVGRLATSWGAAPPGRSAITTGTVSASPSVLLAQAAAAIDDIPLSGGLFLAAPGTGDSGRLAAYVFPPTSPMASALIKVARRSGDHEAFDDDELGQRIVSRAGAVVQTHAPTALGRFWVGDHAASVETAVPGQPLSAILRANRTEGPEIVDRVAGWIVDVGRATARPAPEMRPEHQRIRSEVLPRFAVVEGSVLDAMADVPAVLSHGDLHSRNVLADQHEFGVVDWESARACSFPLWDLCYFLADALAQVDGARSLEERTAGMLDLFRGVAPSSPKLFHWLRLGVSSLAIHPDAVGPLVATLWMHHTAAAMDLSDEARIAPPVERIAPIWLRDPSLGLHWAAWR